MDPDDIYFPEAEDIGPHAIAFAQLMFAHSEFEREVRSLQGTITNDPSFGERRSNQWKGSRAPGTYGQIDQDAPRKWSPRGGADVDHHAPQWDAME